MKLAMRGMIIVSVSAISRTLDDGTITLQ